MKYECRYNQELNIIEIDTSGKANMSGLTDMHRSIVELCAREISANVLIDHSKLDLSQLSMAEVKNMSDITVFSKEIFKMRKCAHVVVKDIQFGLVRAWEIMTEIYGVIDLNMKVFKKRNEAIEWLKTSP